MAERWPDGSNLWQDGDVLTASDLNDTIDALGDGIDTIGEEAQENRLLLNKVQFQTSADSDGDSQNSLADIATDSNGFRGQITAAQFSHINSGIDGFHYPTINNDFTISKSTVTIGKNFERSSYDVIRDEVLIVTATDSNRNGNENIFIDYEIYDTSGSQLRSNTLEIFHNSADNVNPVNGNFISEGSFALYYSYNDGSVDRGEWILIDTVNNNVKADGNLYGGDRENRETNFLGARYASSGNFGEFSVSGYDDTDLDGDVEIISETSSGANSNELINREKLTEPEFVAGIHQNGSFVGCFQFIDDSINQVLVISHESSSTYSDKKFTDSGGGTTGFSQSKAFINEESGEGSIGIDLSNGQLFDDPGNKTKENDLSLLTAYNPTEDIYRATNNHTYINNFKTLNLGSNVGDFSILPSIKANEFFAYAGDGSLYTVVKNDNGDAEIYNVKNQTSVRFATGVQYETGNITHSDNIEYVNARFNEEGSDEITKMKVVDVGSNTVIGTFDTEEKVYIGDQNTSSIKIRLEKPQVPNKSGIKSYSVITW